jgi:hypothetical protein
MAATRAPPGAVVLARRRAAPRCAPTCALPHRRELLAGGAALLGAGVLLPGALPAAAAAASLVPRGAPLGAAGITPSAVIKGCWQLGGGHKGEAATDRTCVACAPGSLSLR